jgi:ankyrin repeat protein
MPATEITTAKRLSSTQPGTSVGYGASEGHCEVAAKLIALGTDVNAEDNNGQTALFYSAREGQKGICELLLQHGANVNKQDKRHLTPYHWAKKHNRHDVDPN